MADQDTIWTAVKAAYPTATLLPLTNIHDRADTAIDDDVGTSAALHVVGLWPSHAEVALDVTDAGHLAVAIEWTVAVLMDRGGTQSETAAKKLERITGDGGLIGKLRRTGPRGHAAAYTTGPDLNADGTQRRNYSNRNAMPPGFLPSDQAKQWYD